MAVAQLATRTTRRWRIDAAALPKWGKPHSFKMAPMIRIEDLLFTQGFGTRRVCAGLLQQGHVRWQGQPIEEGWVEAQAGQVFSVMGQEWAYHERAYLVLHKPLGMECSQKPSVWPSVYTLLPAPLRQRPASNKTTGVQGIGRLDQDTSGLLLLSDDGNFIHRMASPKHHVPKVYTVSCAQSVTDRQIEQLLSGVVLNDDPQPVKALAAARLGETGSNQLDLTLGEGKYHQVKRMLAAVGNEVSALHRHRFGQFSLPPSLQPGQWRWLTPEERQLAQTV